MHSLQALALMQEKRIASDGSLLMRGSARDAGQWQNYEVPFEPGQSVLEGNFVVLPLSGVARAAAPDFQGRDLLGVRPGVLAHDTSASATAGAPEICSSPPRSCTR